MNSFLPLVSCICITNNRIVLLKRAIHCFRNQDYPNKELIISYPKKDNLTRYLLSESIKNEDLKIITLERSDEDLLGDARNQAIAVSKGKYVCIWDDDDWYHPRRLFHQFNYLENNGVYYQANVLSRLLLFDYTTKKIYLSFCYTWEGTLMCKREYFLDYHYDSKNQGEDSNIIDSLNDKRLLYHISDAPFLYIYTYHNNNTWGYAHFESFFKRSILINGNLSLDILNLLNDY